MSRIGGKWDGRRIEALAERIGEAFGLVLLLVTLTFVLGSVLPESEWSRVALLVTANATSIAALTTSHVRVVWIRRAVVLSVVAVVLGLVTAITGEHGWLSVAWLIEIVLLGFSMARVLITVVVSPQINTRTILGALSVYGAFGLLFTALYELVDRIQDATFFSGVSHPGTSDFMFFSYTTLTTTGYGDLVPAGQPGQMIAGLEMMLGPIFLITLVAGLVSGWRPGEGMRRRQQRRSGNPAESSSSGP